MACLAAALTAGSPDMPDVVVAGEADHLAAVDHRGVVDDRLMDLEIGMRQAGGGRVVHGLLQLQVFGELIEAVIDDGGISRASASLAAADGRLAQVDFHRRGHFAAGFDRGEHFFRESGRRTWSSSAAMISMRSSESSPSSTIELSIVMPAARSLPMRRTCSITISAVEGMCGRARSPRRFRRANRRTRGGWHRHRPRSPAPVAAAAARQRRGGIPLADDFQTAVEIGLPAGVALDLAAGGLGNAAGLDQHDGFDVQFVLGGDFAANGLEHRLQIAILPALDLVDQHQPIAAVDAGRRTRPPGRVAAARGSCWPWPRCPADNGSGRG